MSTVAQPGDRVLIMTSELQEDPNVYTLDEVKRSVAFLTSVDTGRKVKVHKTRIREVLKEDNMSDNENETAVIDQIDQTDQIQDQNAAAPANANETETVIVDEEPKAEKPKRKRKPKAEPVKVNFNEAPFAGREIWTKGDCKFDFDQISVAAHCIILDNGYQTFNTYNGTLGKKAQLPEDGSLPGVFYSFNEKLDADKKREQLGKKGYTLQGAPVAQTADTE